MRPFQIENKEALSLALKILTNKIAKSGFTISDIREGSNGNLLEWTIINGQNRKEQIEVFQAMNWKLNKMETEMKHYLVRSNCFQLLTNKTFI
tara:strand:- start:25 stop:303 length:279 start_codon:yes stop_codon:yes gene_type:complete